MRPSGSLNELDDARSPDSCNNCERVLMCGISAARREFSDNKFVQNCWMLSANLKLEESLAKNCGHYLRMEVR